MAVLIAVVALAVSSFTALACLAFGTALLAVWTRDVTLGELHGGKIELLSIVLSAVAVATTFAA